ncbi:NAD(P)/FAD-dependent oxidoreductase [Neorhodopirellula lusitana]|nr:FAD-dependent oxidoreductase [Neorhodopirellula lusitana]
MSTEKQSLKITVVGGGVIGLSVAWELSKRGCSVQLLERQTASSANLPDQRCTSWTAGGILPPANFERATDPMERFRGYSHSQWPAWAAELERASGISTGLVRCGGYYLAETAGEAAAMIGMVDYWDEMGIECENISLARLCDQQPQLKAWSASSTWGATHPDSAAWWVPDEWQVRPPRLLHALHSGCQKNGVEFRYGEDVDEQRLHSIQGESDATVLCGGVRTGLIADSLSLGKSLVPIRGQMLLYRCDEFDNPIVINVGNRYLIARGDGMVLVGSCEEEVGMDQTTTDTAIESLRDFAVGVCPLLGDAPEVTRWAGLRPMTFDGFPIIGPVPSSSPLCDHERLFVASGHYRSGIHFAPATAIAIADKIQGRDGFMDMHPFSVGHQQEHSR